MQANKLMRSGALESYVRAVEVAIGALEEEEDEGAYLVAFVVACPCVVAACLACLACLSEAYRAAYQAAFAADLEAVRACVAEDDLP
mmetsp:Transcript_30837/g.54112  ORF Transcript_30837/g.54112 Transcript_30837/m.54112 type:complete len:87 (-) Transcript_30837:962-1222(-)